LAHILHACHQAVDNRQSVRAAFIDFAKAFDHVDHSIVLNKMMQLGVQPFVIRWMHSFLIDRTQRVKINNSVSSWTTLNGGMPQGTWLGPYIFLIHINDLRTEQLTFKFIDDVTIVEVLNSLDRSKMQLSFDTIAKWSTNNHMNINISKTKEMLINVDGSSHSSIASLTLNNHCIERVSSFKLLGITLSADLSWSRHVREVCAKANKRLHFLKLLKRSKMTTDGLLLYYKAIIRPVIEYACPVWQSSLTVNERRQLETVQKRAVFIISGSDDYEFYCSLYDLELIQTRLDNLSRKFYYKTLQPHDCLNKLIPQRETEYIAKLRSAKLYDFHCRTSRFLKSFFPYAITNY
jgi:hypothetical protein